MITKNKQFPYLFSCIIFSISSLFSANTFSKEVDNVQMVREMPKIGYMLDMISFKNKAYFLRTNQDSYPVGIRGDASTLWVSDGSTEGTRTLKKFSNRRLNYLGFINRTWGDDYSPDSPPIPIILEGNFFFITTYVGNPFQNWLWKSDGTEEGTILVKYLGTSISSDSFNSYAVINNILYLIGDGLWRTDGTTSGTRKISDNGGRDLVAFNDKLYFSSYDPVHDRELWVSDGTAAGTKLFKDILTFDRTSNCGESSCTNSSSNQSNLRVYRDNLYFTADDGVHGSELWKTDGTAAGTELVADIFPGPQSSFFSNPIIFNGELIFSATNNFSRRGQLWKIDSSQNNIVLIKEFFLKYRLRVLDGLIVKFNSELFFSIIDYAFPRDTAQLWRTNGTTTGTKLVGDNLGLISPRGGTGQGRQSGAVELDNKFYFGAYINPILSNIENNVELWSSNGTTGGIHLVKDLFPGERPSGTGNASSPRLFVRIGDRILFAATFEEYKAYDGTTTRYKEALYSIVKVTVNITPVLQLLLTGEK